MGARNDLGAQITMAAAAGKLAPDAANAMFAVLAGAPILRTTPTKSDRIIGARAISQTRDSEGNVLVAGQNYTLHGNVVKVLREEFGGGNVCDTFQRVYFLGSDLKESFAVVDGTYPQGALGGADYNSRFVPVKEKAS
jgi:hypothetical protein